MISITVTNKRTGKVQSMARVSEDAVVGMLANAAENVDFTKFRIVVESCR